MGNGRRHGGGASALSALAVSESAALMLPVFAGCHSLDLRSLQRPALTQRSPAGAFHDSANFNLAKRRLCVALGISLGSSEHCCAISVARVRAALTASIPRSNRPLARRTNFGAAKSCSLVIIFMIRPPTAQSGESHYAHRSRPYHGSRNTGDSARPVQRGNRHEGHSPWFSRCSHTCEIFFSSGRGMPRLATRVWSRVWAGSAAPPDTGSANITR
jgi:hypothetical protein